MNAPQTAPRQAEAPVDSQFLDRWSPRAFAAEAVSPGKLASLFEAARWSPSCFNEQPWLFVYATAPEDRQRVLELLVEGNRVWAQHAPVLGVVFAKRRFGHNDKPNRWGGFDAGAAAFSFTLQANKLGLSTHFMGGFSAEASYNALGVPEADYEAMAAFAVGVRGEASSLPEEIAEREHPSSRKPLSEVAFQGRFTP